MYNKAIFKRRFNYRKKYWWKNIKEIPLYFYLIHDLIKHGYDEYATWEMPDWFIHTMIDIFTRYRKNHHGYPVIEGMTNERWECIIDRMIELLKIMHEDSLACDGIEYDKETDKPKDEFFELFSKYFYYLWD